MYVSVCERALFVKLESTSKLRVKHVCKDGKIVVHQQERAHPNRGRWKEEKQVSVRLFFSFWTGGKRQRCWYW